MKIYLPIFLFMFCFNAYSQIPQTMSYQGVLTGSNGEPVANANYEIIFKLYEDTMSQTAIWEENQSVAVVNGLFNAILGSTNPLALTFDRPYWLGVTIGSEEELNPRTPLTTSPYSFSAATVADSAITTDKLADGAVTKEKLAVGALSDSSWIVSGDDIFSGVPGNVGVGVNQPQEKLHVAGNVLANSFSGNGTALNFNQDSNMQPFGTVNYIIALEGIFPSRNAPASEGFQSADPFIGEIVMFGGNFAPRGWAMCDGQLLAISQFQGLFSILGTTYGGDGRTSFGLPDLRGRAPIHAGQGAGLSNRRLGRIGGRETINN